MFYDTKALRGRRDGFYSRVAFVLTLTLLSVVSGVSPAQAHCAQRHSSFAYVANTFAGTISEFAVLPNGTFALITTITLPRALSYVTHDASGFHVVPLPGNGRQEPLSPVIHPNGHYVYFADLDGGVVLQYRIAPSGTLTPLSPPQVAAGPQPGAIALDPAGRYAYVATATDILQYRVKPDGKLAPLSPPRAAASELAGANSLAASPDGRFLYNSVGGGLVYQYRITGNGTLQPLNPKVAAAGASTHWIAVAPKGRFAYAAEFEQSLILQYRIRPNGTLKLLSPQYVLANPMSASPTQTNPIWVSVSPDGRFVYVANSSTNALSQFRVRQDGTLTPLKPMLVRLHAAPVSLAFSPDGRLVYVPNGKTISRFRIAGNGTLHPLSPAWASPRYHPAFLVLSRRR